MPTKPVCCNLGHSLPEPLMRDFLSPWIAFWSLARSEIPQVSSQHFLNSSLLLQKSTSQESVSFFDAPESPFETSITFYVLTGHRLGRMILHPCKHQRQDPSSSDSWHQPSWNTLHRAAFSRLSLLVSLLSLLRFAPFICFPQLFSSSVILAYSWSWFRHGRDRMISAGKTAFFLCMALNPAIIQLPVLN